ncbi:MAG: T9SS type A sorting domain-containing protein, partial [Bacteroidota bacterium]
ISFKLIEEIGQAGMAGDYGLVCDNGTEIGQQLYIDIVTDNIRHSGNRWFTDNYSATGALHLGTVEDIENSEFVVGDAVPPLYPASTPLGAVVPSSFFTISNLEELPPCNQNIECFPDQAIVSTSDDGRIARLARRTPYTLSPYREMLNWEANAHLLALLKSNSDLLGQDVKVDSFYAVQRNTMLEALGEVKMARRQVFDRQALNTPVLLRQSEQIETALSELTALRAAYHAATDLEERQSIIVQQRAIAQSLGRHKREQNILLEQIREAIQQDVNLVELENSTLSPSGLLPKNEQVVNSIHLAYLHNPNILLFPLQIEQLYGIAIQCPKLGGRVVYRARLLYEILVASNTWKNQESCEEVEARSQTKPVVENTQPQNMKLYPNPAHQSVTVELDKVIMENQDIQFQIYTVTGEMVLIASIQDQFNTVALQHLSEGLYFCSLFIDGIHQQTKRLVIIK